MFFFSLAEFARGWKKPRRRKKENEQEEEEGK